jgi:uncharacterized protein
MTPIFRILADSLDVTARIADRLVSLTVSDEAGWQSDTVEIVVDDRDALLAVPATGAELSVSLGYAETGALDMGLYRVDEVEMSGPERQMRIRGKASDSRDKEMLGRIKAPKSRSWHETTLGDLVKSIASEHGFDPVVGDALAGIAIPHVDQSEESDINLLQRLARDNGAIVKPANGKLLFVLRGEAKTASGKAMPNIALGPGDVDTWRVTLAERAKYRSVVARWQDQGSADLVPEQVGEGDPVYSIRHTYRDAAQARRAAEAKLDAFQRGAATLDITMPARPEVGAECTLYLAGFRPGVDGRWVITRAEHRIEDGGYTCSVSAEVPKTSETSEEGQ